MNRTNQPWRPLPTADVDWLDDGTPRSRHFDDVYYSRTDGLRESRHVFLAGSNLPQRWQAHPQPQFTVVETGFGTGLNFLACWHAWRAAGSAAPRLHYVSIEGFPLRRSDAARALGSWPELQPLAAQLLDRYPDPIPGRHRLLFEQGRLVLDLHFAAIDHALTELAAEGAPLADAWFLDGFAPARNAAMWREELFPLLAAASRPDATVATFSSAGIVRRGLADAGFQVEKRPGFGRKREQLSARLIRPSRRAPVTETPWHLPAHDAPVPERCIVIGAGLAGCTAAAALARRGVAVLLLEQDEPAGAASGNRQGVLYTRLSPRHSPLSDFALTSYAFATRFYADLLAGGELCEDEDGALCGAFHQASGGAELQQLRDPLAAIPAFAQVLDAAAANRLLGIEQQQPGYWFPGAGWMNPVAVCRTLAERPGITLRSQCGPLELRRSGALWQVHAAGQPVAEAPCVVVACGIDCTRLTGLDWLPLRAIRGQVTQLPAAAPWSALRAVLCHDGYIAPACSEGCCIGATFDIDVPDSTVRTADHRRNLAALGAAVPGWRDPLANLNSDTLPGRVGFRCASPDYLPLAGPVPDHGAFLRCYAGLRKNARQIIPDRGCYMPGLYLSTAHGSRGLTSTPLAAELLASMVCHEPLPLEYSLRRALAPARFIIRDLVRSRA
jgi:tRNA 5-methylaminomethyl-2-thiouridine biosynthesis bifunctional protein